MSKDKKHTIAVIVFILGLFLFLGLDYAQDEFEIETRMAVNFYHSGQTLIQISLLVFVMLKTCKLIHGLAFTWIAYKTEILYDLFFNGGEYELYEWSITTGLVLVYLIYNTPKFIEQIKKSISKDGRND